MKKHLLLSALSVLFIFVNACSKDVENYAPADPGSVPAASDPTVAATSVTETAVKPGETTKSEGGSVDSSASGGGTTSTPPSGGEPPAGNPPNGKSGGGSSQPVDEFKTVVLKLDDARGLFLDKPDQTDISKSYREEKVKEGKQIVQKADCGPGSYIGAIELFKESFFDLPVITPTIAGIRVECRSLKDGSISQKFLGRGEADYTDLQEKLKAKKADKKVKRYMTSCPSGTDQTSEVNFSAVQSIGVNHDHFTKDMQVTCARVSAAKTSKAPVNEGIHFVAEPSSFLLEQKDSNDKTNSYGCEANSEVMTGLAATYNSAGTKKKPKTGAMVQVMIKCSPVNAGE